MRIIKFMAFWIILLVFVAISLYVINIIVVKGFAKELVGAFFGAFFAAISVVMYEIFLKYRDKEVERVNNLILYQLELNKCMRILSDLNYQIKHRIESKDTETQAVIHYLSLEPLTISFAPIIGIRHIGVKNQMIGLEADFCKINTDLEGLMLVYRSNIQMVINTPADMASRVQQLKILNKELIEQLKYFYAYIDETIKEIEDCVAGIRVIYNWDKPSLIKHVYRYFTGWDYDEIRYEVETKEEKVKMASEIENIQKESEKKISKAKIEVFGAQ